MKIKSASDLKIPELRKTFPDAFRVSETLAGAGHRAFFAGGCVRDWLLGLPAKDIDIATDASPDEVERLFPRTHAIGKAFGVIQVVEGEGVYEVASFRRDLDQTDGRHPGRIEPSTPEEDARRRDFTVNGLFLDPANGEILDFVGGLADVRAGVVRAIGDPAERFREDHLRMLRAARFASVLGFAIDPATADAVRARAEDLRKISVERVRGEFTRILTESPRAGDAVELLHGLGLLARILPEFPALRGCGQPPEFHPEGDVWTHTVMMLNELSDPSPALALAVLLHDIGKPATRTVENGRVRFTGHAQVGARIAAAWMKRMKYPNALRERVAGMVDRHMNFMNVPHMKKSTLRRLVGQPSFKEELELHRIDCLCSNGITATHTLLQQVRADYEAEEALPEPWVTGRDLLEVGITEGPEIGEWKRRAYDEQLEGNHASREALLAWVRSQLPLTRNPSAT